MMSLIGTHKNGWPILDGKIDMSKNTRHCKMGAYVLHILPFLIYLEFLDVSVFR